MSEVEWVEYAVKLKHRIAQLEQERNQLAESVKTLDQAFKKLRHAVHQQMREIAKIRIELQNQ